MVMDAHAQSAPQAARPRSPAAAALLSLVLPGLGQFYLGDRASAVTVFCIVAALLAGLAWSLADGALLSAILLGVIYVLVWIPSVVDAARAAGRQGPSLMAGANPWYVIFMLLAAGPAAIPMLWHSRAFSRGEKIAWTVFVILIAVSFIALVLFVIPRMLDWAEARLDALPQDAYAASLRRLIENLR
ncbi:MAG TPA: hypothetical protein VGB20_07100 [bacterium]